MESLICTICILYYISSVSAYDPFEGFLERMLPCFPVIKLPAVCNKKLSESFTPEYPPNIGINEINTSVYLFTNKNKETAEPLHLCGGRLPPTTTYDPNADTEVIIHGFLDGICRTAWMREMKEQFFLRGPYNVILVDWTWGNTFDYKLSVHNCKIVGEQIGFVIKNILQQTGVSPDKFHVIGHSLGALAAGFVGRSILREGSKRKLGRITALDPAYIRLGYEFPLVSYKDAQIVDVIHSNAQECLAIGFGNRVPMGHANFYPNGGFIQPACYPYAIQSILKGDILYGAASLMFPMFCFHLQSIQYFKVSINSKGCDLIGVASDSYKSFTYGQFGNDWAIMGMNYNNTHRSDWKGQKFYLETSHICPYYNDFYLRGRQYPVNSTCSRICSK